jgi:type VI secretion system protein ImpI
MALNLQLVNETTLPDGGPASFRISGKRGIDIGRDTHLDWTLPDPTRYISSRHCEIRYKDGGYWLHDVSTNGTLLNGADHRMQAPHRLRTGDRFTIGHYIVAVTVEGEEGAAAASPLAAPAPVPPSGYDELWVSQGVAPPPIDPKLLKAARQNNPVHSDFLDWAADIPAPFQPPAPPQPAPPSARASPAPASVSPAGSDMDWAAGPPSRVPPPPPPPLPRPAPRRPEWDAGGDSPWGDATTTAAADPSPQAAAAPAGAVAPQTFPPLTPAGPAPEDFIRLLARAAGLPEDVLAQRDPSELAQQIGGALRLVAENLMQLLNARQQAKRLARSSRHTMIQAVDNNPLKFCPAAPDALRIMFGPATAGYLDASRAIGQGFDDLKAHQVKTYSAMQHALTVLLADLDPRAVEREADEGRGIAGLLVSRKAKLWDAYAARWENTIGRAGGGPIEAFMAYFAEAYDRDGG